MTWFFVFFTISGFCGILYELVWMRLAMAQFTVTTPFVSIVMSLFMLGMGLGSWQGGRWIRSRNTGSGALGLKLYALVELLIGVSALVVPLQLAWGRTLMRTTADGLPAGGYYLIAGAWMAFSLVPWCACMGATYPFAMAAIRQMFPAQSERSFSYLYLANISGAVLGTAVPLLLIEALGFRGTSYVGMALNLMLSASAFGLSMRATPQSSAALKSVEPERTEGPHSRSDLWMLFGTGLCTMGVEIVWVRVFTAYLGTLVYAFAAILGVYLAATYVGSKVYRSRKDAKAVFNGGFLALMGLSALIALVACDPRRDLNPLFRLLIGVAPFSAATGFLTPLLLDRYSRGNPDRAGSGYAINVAGCVAGPLLSAFVFLPLVGERWSMLLFALPWLVAGACFESGKRRPFSMARFAMGTATALILAIFTRTWESGFTPKQVLRDHTATVMAAGDTLANKRLLVNGIGMTILTPITKMMAHLPVAFSGRAANALVICFGMGTTHRSIISWGIRSTAVELTPSVPRLFGYYHADAAEVAASPLSRIVIDDGRLYMERNRQQYDVIVIDPPPPVEAAGSSLLYSREFYSIAKDRMLPGAILQQWLPPAEPAVKAAVMKALLESFPHVRVFGSVENNGGYHFLASLTPLPRLSAAELAARLPAHAAADLVEWGPAANAEAQFALVLNREIQPASLIVQAPSVPALQDDRPINEYFILRMLSD